MLSLATQMQHTTMVESRFSNKYLHASISLYMSTYVAILISL